MIRLLILLLGISAIGNSLYIEPPLYSNEKYNIKKYEKNIENNTVENVILLKQRKYNDMYFEYIKSNKDSIIQTKKVYDKNGLLLKIEKVAKSYKFIDASYNTKGKRIKYINHDLKYKVTLEKLLLFLKKNYKRIDFKSENFSIYLNDTYGYETFEQYKYDGINFTQYEVLRKNDKQKSAYMVSWLQNYPIKNCSLTQGYLLKYVIFVDTKNTKLLSFSCGEVFDTDDPLDKEVKLNKAKF
jgi:lipopolysaccharide export LptBFGC system permease protein LptF